MKEFCLIIDDKFDAVLNELKEALGKDSQAEVIRIAVALLKISVETAKDGKIAIVGDMKLLEERGAVEIGKEIEIPLRT